MKARKMSHWKSFLLIALMALLIMGTVSIGGILSIAPSDLVIAPSDSTIVPSDSTTESAGVVTASLETESSDVVTASPDPGETRIHVVPPSVMNTSLTPGSIFTVDINVSDVEDLFSWQIVMSWKTSLLYCTKNIKGDFLKDQPGGTFFTKRIKNDEGWCGFGEATLGIYPGVSGSGWLGSVEFRVEGTGETVLNITDPVGLRRTYWQDSFLAYGDFIPEDGYFSNTEEVIQYELTIDVVGSGTTNPSPGSYMYDEDTPVSVDALPASGWMLDHWDLDGANVGDADPYTVIMNSDHILTAIFVEEVVQYELTVNSNPITGVEFTLDSVTQTTTYSGSLVGGSHTIVMPSTWGIYDFDQWEDASTNPTRTISLTADMTVTAYYVKRQWTLTVVSDPIDGVEFTLDGAPHTTPWSDILDEGSHTVVMPSTWTVGEDVYNFDHWEDMSTNPTRIISLTTDMTATAYYALSIPQYELIIDVVGAGSTVPTPGTYIYNASTEASVAALPDSGWRLDHWDLDGFDVGDADPYNVTMNANHTLTAFFVEIRQLTVNSDPITGVEFTLDGLPHTTPWSDILDEGSHTVVMPSTWGVYDFDQWEDASTDPTRIISLTADMTVTAYYVKRQWTLNVNSDPIDGVDFTLDATPHATPWSGLLDEGAYTIVMPSTWTVGTDVYNFDHWEDASTNPTRAVSLTADTSIMAYYVLVAVPETIIFFDPSTVTANPGESFTINIKISDAVEPVYSWGIKLGWGRPGLLECSPGDIDEGPFLSEDGMWMTFFAKSINPTYIDIGCTMLEPPPAGVTGSGVLATVTFRVAYTGNATLDLYDTILTKVVDTAPQPIDHTSVDGYFYTTRPVAQPIYDPPYLGHFYVPELGRPIVGESITFNASACYDPDDPFDPTPGGIVSYTWDFGDGSGIITVSDPIITHAYTTAGTYFLTLNVTDDDGETSPTITESINIKLHDIAVITVTASPTTVEVGEPVTISVTVENQGTEDETFDLYVYADLDTTDIGDEIVVGTMFDISLDAGALTVPLEFTWDTTGVAEGTYTISAEVSEVPNETDTADNTRMDGIVDVTLPEVPPIASFTYSPVSPVVDEMVSFDASASYDLDGIVVSYAWEFGDGTSGTGMITTHAYTAAGTYTVTLTVTDDDGLTDTEMHAITVSLLPPEDVTPPTIIINEPEARDYLLSETLTLDFTAVDTESGVASISATLNGLSVESGESIEPYNLGVGGHTLTVTAVDNAGNPATETVEFNVVATVGSLQDLVTIFWESGFFYSPKGIYTSFMKKLYVAEKCIDAGLIDDAKDVLGAFINHLEAQAGKHVSERHAYILIEGAQYVIDHL